MNELTPKHVLADLFGSGDFPPEILLDPAHAADVVIQQLNDAGFKIESAGNYFLTGKATSANVPISYIIRCRKTGHHDDRRRDQNPGASVHTFGAWTPRAFGGYDSTIVENTSSST